MADLSTLMQISPYGAAWMAGQNNALDQQKSQADIQSLQQAMQLKAAQEARTQQEFPLTLDKLQLGNDTTRAQLPGVQAESRTKGLNADLQQATQPGQIAATNSKNQDQVLRDTYYKLSALTGDMGSLSDPEKLVRVNNAIDQMQLPQAAADRLRQRLNGVPPANLESEINGITDKMLRANPAWAQAFDPASLHTSAQIVAGAAHNASQERIAQMYLEGGRWGAKGPVATTPEGWTASIQKAGSPMAKYAQALMASQFFYQNGDSDNANRFRQMADQIEKAAQATVPGATAAAGGINAPAVTGMPANPPPDIRPPDSPAAAPNIQDALKKQGIAFEPNKYQYRIGPNGQVQRKAK